MVRYWLDAEWSGPIGWIKRHLKSCPRCQAYQELDRAYEAAIATARQTPVPPARLEWNQVQARLSAAIEQPYPARIPHTWNWAFSGLATVLILGAIVLHWMHANTESPMTGSHWGDLGHLSAPPIVETLKTTDPTPPNPVKRNDLAPQARLSERVHVATPSAPPVSAKRYGAAATNPTNRVRLGTASQHAADELVKRVEWMLAAGSGESPRVIRTRIYQLDSNVEHLQVPVQADDAGYEHLQVPVIVEDSNAISSS